MNRSTLLRVDPSVASLSTKSIWLAVVLAGVTVSAIAGPIRPVIPDVARPLPLTAVRLTGGPLKNAQDLDAKYLLELEPDRMMAGYRLRAGLEPKAEGYGGWDGVNSRQLTGHIGGHYLSAVSLMFATTGDPRFKERADYIVKELQAVQDKQGDGYLGALLGNGRAARGGQGETTNAAALGGGGGGGRGRGQQQAVDGKQLFAALSDGTIQSGGFDLNGMWSPWYVLHKTFAGLRDAYRFTGNSTALSVETKFAAWAQKILAPLNDAQIQQMLATEFGGMNEVLADLYADTGDKQWLDLSYQFEHERFIEPLQRHEDRLSGQHGNTAIPKIVGSASRFGYQGDAGDIIAASYFWDTIVHHHTFATGGNSVVENFPQTDTFGDAVTGGGRTCESCNVYNMLKLTRRLFAYRPDVEYADYQERALFNHVLASIDPTDGWTSYMVPVGQGVRQEYERNMLDGGFTCCVGSGMESHALHADGIYYENGQKLWVNIYAPSTVQWAAQNAKLEMQTDFPEGETAKLTVNLSSPKPLTLALRRPSWAGTNFAVKVNGEVLADSTTALARGGRPGAPGAGIGGRGFGRGGRGGTSTSLPASSYVEIKRTWNNGDTVELTMPKTLRLEPTPDNPNRVAVLWGPLVLAGDLGEGGGRAARGGRGTPASVPVFLAANKPVAEWMKPVDGPTAAFRTASVGRVRGSDTASDVNFIPFYRMHRRSYGVYWELAAPETWESSPTTVTATETQRRLEAATVALVQPGEMQSERDFNYQSSVLTRAVEDVGGRHGRGGAGWFSFEVPVDPAHPIALRVSFNSQSPAGNFEVQIDGTRIGQQTANTLANGFYEAEYAIPANLVQGKLKVTVRFQAAEGGEVGPVFGIRMIRADAER